MISSPALLPGLPLPPMPIDATTFAALPTRRQLQRVEKLARNALPLYGLSLESSVKLLNYSENATYLISPPDADPVVLRINRPGYHSRSHIATEISWVNSLARETPLRIAEPIAGCDGEFIQHIWHPDVPEPRNCVLMTFLPGCEPDGTNRLTAFSLLGKTTAHLHRHAEQWKPAHPILRNRWDFDTMFGKQPIWGRWQDSPGMTPAKKSLLTRLVKTLRPRIEALGESRSRFGLVHADLRAANLLVHGGEVAVIDFDDCGFSWFIYDLAAALSFIETHPDVPACVEAWLAAYQQIRPLSRAEIASIPSFILLRRLLLLAWVGSHADSEQAKAVSPHFADDTCHLAEEYLSA